MNETPNSTQRPLAELQNGDRFTGIVLVRSADMRTSNAGKRYLDINVSDRSGIINGKMWDSTAAVPKAGTVIYVRATGNEYNGRMQLRIEKIDLVQANVDWSLLVPTAPENPDSMMSEIMEGVNLIKDEDYRKITLNLLEKASDAIMTFPAAKQMHHAERSGLLHHTVTMLRTAIALLPIYPKLNPSLLLAGVIVHDLGKITEMQADSTGFVSDYTLDGKLIGHIVRGTINVEKAGMEVGANPDKILLLQHMLLSHHGLAEYGSPKPPMFPEAEVLHLIDTLDARLNEMEDAITYTRPGSFSEKVWGLDNRQIYHIPEDN